MYTWGVVFAADGRADSSLHAHLDAKNKELNKLLIFFATNYDAPFLVKKRVLEAVFMSCILYGCESWLNISLKPVETMYLKAVKALLGVRITTPNNLCLIEAGFKPLSRIVKSCQKKFFRKMVTSQSGIFDDPFMHSMKVTQELDKSMWKYIDSTMKRGDFVSKEMARLKDAITNSDPAATKFQTY